MLFSKKGKQLEAAYFMKSLFKVIPKIFDGIIFAMSASTTKEIYVKFLKYVKLIFILTT